MAKITPSFYSAHCWLSVHLVISPHALSHLTVTLKKYPSSSFKPLFQKYDDAAEGTELIFLPGYIYLPSVRLFKMLMWSVGLTLPPCQRLLFRALARSASLQRGRIQPLAAQHSVTLGEGSQTGHITSPICHSLIPCPPVEKHCCYKYWMHRRTVAGVGWWGGGGQGVNINVQMKPHRKQNSLPRSLTAVTHADVTRDEHLRLASYWFSSKEQIK